MPVEEVVPAALSDLNGALCRPNNVRHDDSGESAIGLRATAHAGQELLDWLDRDDVNLDDGVLRIREAKFGKSRAVPLHPSTVVALAAYTRRRNELCPRPRDPSFFVSTVGTRLRYDN